MELVPLLRMLGALGVVLGLLSGALWLVRRFDVKLPGRMMRSPDRRLEMIERLSIDTKRTLALIRRDGREHLILIAPEGSIVVDTNVGADSAPRAAEAAPLSFEAQATQAVARQQVSSLVERLRSRDRKPAEHSAEPAVAC